jgi:hypothetical protein
MLRREVWAGGPIWPWAPRRGLGSPRAGRARRARRCGPSRRRWSPGPGSNGRCDPCSWRAEDRVGKLASRRWRGQSHGFARRWRGERQPMQRAPWLDDDGRAGRGAPSRWRGQWHRQSTRRPEPAPAWRRAVGQPRIVAASLPSRFASSGPARRYARCMWKHQGDLTLGPRVQNRGAKSRPRCECAMNAALRNSSDALWLNGSNHAAGLGVYNRKVSTNDHQADSRRGCPGRGCARHSGICRAACGSGVDVDRGARRPTSSHAWTPAPSLAPLSPLPRGLPRLLA